MQELLSPCRLCSYMTGIRSSLEDRPGGGAGVVARCVCWLGRRDCESQYGSDNRNKLTRGVRAHDTSPLFDRPYWPSKPARAIQSLVRPLVAQRSCATVSQFTGST